MPALDELLGLTHWVYIRGMGVVLMISGGILLCFFMWYISAYVPNLKDGEKMPLSKAWGFAVWLIAVILMVSGIISINAIRS